MTDYIYKIPEKETSLPQSGSNPGAVTTPDTIPSQSSGISEQQVRNIVNQHLSTGLKEEQVRDIVNSMQRTGSGTNTMMDGYLKSQNYYTGVSGWQIDADGNVEFGSGYFRGDITGASGTFSGTITATTGAIGGFDIGADYLRDAANSFGLASTVTGGNDVRFWAGDTFANRATAELRIYEDGSIVGTNATFTGALFATSGWIGSATALVYESTGIDTGITGHIRGGQTSYNTGTGYFMGYDTGAYKLSIGVSTGDSLTWDGTTLNIAGTFSIGGTTITVDTIAEAYTALTTISNAGGGTLYLDNGTYTLTADLVIPSGVTVQGVSRDEVIIDCDGTYAVKISGTDVYSTGTVTINNGDTEVVGSGTTWTAGMVGRYIMLDGLWYEITARTDNTHITIGTYVGDNLASSAYVLANPNFTSYLRKLTITGATGAGVVISHAQEPNLFDLVIYGNGTGIDADYVTYLQLNSIAANENGVNLDMNFVEGFYIDWSDFSNSTTGAGVVMTNYTRNATFFNTSVADNTGNGISVTLGSKIAFISLDVSGNGGKGIEFIANNNNNSISDSVFDGNTSDGIKLTATTDDTQIIGAGVQNSGGYGINIAASTCDNNQIIAPAFENNTSGNINDSGTNTFVSPQQVGSNVQIFTSSGTWTKPSSGTMATIQIWGAGGSGGKSSSGNAGGGGGGGGYSEITIPLSSLGATETVTLGDGGTSVTTADTPGNAGGNSTFGSILTAYGGGGGGGDIAYTGGGGGGGGSSSAGGNSTSANGGNGGSFQGGAGGIGSNADGSISFFGGGGGGGGGVNAGSGAESIYGGGGGCGGMNSGANIDVAGASRFGGGGGGGGADTGSAGDGSAGGISKFGGNGGKGGSHTENGVAGSQPGGGGGGTETGNTGAGGKGKCIVITF